MPVVGTQGRQTISRCGEDGHRQQRRQHAREKGFTDTIAKFPKITYLSQSEYAGATSDSAQKTAQSLIARYGKQVDGIFCSNESATSGMLRVLRDAGMLASRSKP